MPTREVNYDGIVGPTHHYGGLAPGNLASQRHAHQTSNPRDAALEGLAKMKRVHDLGIPQAVLPPHDRPAIHILRSLGFLGDDAAVLAKARREDPTLLAATASASPMWAANAATISPSADTADRRIHITPANLLHAFHRSLEPDTTATLLRKLLPDESHFAHHPPLPPHARYADEGAANHMRLAPAHDQPGLELFVFGRACDDPIERQPRRHPARQSQQASQAIARRHQLAPNRALLLRQNPDAIDAGAFHNDVVAVSHENVLLHHERAFAETALVSERIRDAYRDLTGNAPVRIEILQDELPLAAAVDSYLFNSQLLTRPDGSIVLLAPIECHEGNRVRACIDRIIADAANPIAAVQYANVRQSMHNGGGPACLRLRIVMTEAEYAAAHPHVMFTASLYEQLTTWVEHHYRDHLTADDLADPALLRESRDALDALTRLLHLGNIYPFQQ
ncbi:N-succinylarginine dihydrolase [Phycisphaerales bacterium AB-hyl4]|uniref:N-succinylarginine dihydrolase n=1 Tax=Natronomicrosphaera hydrolytica TaxID=3242702 RepID=A0ABV4U3C1_9BACT